VVGGLSRRALPRWCAYTAAAAAALKPDPAAPAGVEHAPGPYEYVEVMADRLFRACESARAEATQLDGAHGIRSASTVLTIPRRAPSPAQLELARRLLEQATEEVDLDAYQRRLTGRPSTIFDLEASRHGLVEQARRTLAFAANGRTHEPVEVQVLAIGDAAFVAYPAELFAEHGLRTKSRSPFPATVVCGVANGYFGYVPTRSAFAHGGYETELEIGPLAPGAGELMTEAALGHLCGLTHRGHP
jgi:hypothetical protein